MASAYPGSLDSFATDKTNSTTTEDDHPGHHNDLADAVNKIEAELGTDPAGSESTVVARLDAADAALAVPARFNYLQHRLSDETPNALDDFFDDATKTGWTEVTASGTAVWTEKYDVMSVKFTNQSSVDWAASLKSLDSASAPVTVETHITTAMAQTQFVAVGIGMATGTLTSSTFQGVVLGIASNIMRVGTTITSGGTITNNDWGAHAQISTINEGFYLRWIWEATNQFSWSISPDAVSWTSMGDADQTPTLAPTHVALLATSYGIAHSNVATFDYLRGYNADLSTT